MIVLETKSNKKYANRTPILSRSKQFFDKSYNMINDELEANPVKDCLKCRSKSDSYKSYCERCKAYYESSSPSSLKQTSKTFVDELVSKNIQEPNLLNGGEPDLNFYTIEDVHVSDEKLNCDDDFLEPTLACKYIDARWEALCSQLEDGQELTPCPTCGRKFNTQAAYRHFPICSRVNDKLASHKFPKLKSSPSNSAVPSPVEEQSMMSRADTAKVTLEKPFKMSYTRTSIPWRVQPKQQSASIPFEKCSSKPILTLNADMDLSECQRDMKTLGYNKSATFWKRSSKNLKGPDNSWLISESKKCNNLLFPSNPSVDESKQHNKMKTFTSRLVKTKTISERRAIDKTGSAKTKIVESYTKRSTSKIINVGNSQSTAADGESPVNDWELSTNEKLSSCASCGLRLRKSVLEQHSLLCKRLKMIELQITKEKKKNDKDFRVLPQGTETASTINLKTVASVACPCCSNYLEIKHR